ncbi:MAG: NAD(P)-dependent oxidoreductase, partial [Comamonadaceae bacterium]
MASNELGNGRVGLTHEHCVAIDTSVDEKNTETAVSPVPFQRLLLTGAAGALGRVLRPALRPHAQILRVSDRLPVEAAGADEVLPCDLADKAATDALVHGCDAIVHLGGISVEQPFEEVLDANIRGVFHLYEG